jgi:hypothetical protein
MAPVNQPDATIHSTFEFPAGGDRSPPPSPIWDGIAGGSMVEPVAMVWSGALSITLVPFGLRIALSGYPRGQQRVLMLVVAWSCAYLL